MIASTEFQLNQYKEILFELIAQIKALNEELSTVWQSDEIIPCKEAIEGLRQQIQTCTRLCEK